MEIILHSQKEDLKFQDVDEFRIFLQERGVLSNNIYKN